MAKKTTVATKKGTYPWKLCQRSGSQKWKLYGQQDIWSKTFPDKAHKSRQFSHLQQLRLRSCICKILCIRMVQIKPQDHPDTFQIIWTLILIIQVFSISSIVFPDDPDTFLIISTPSRSFRQVAILWTFSRSSGHLQHLLCSHGFTS